MRDNSKKTSQERRYGAQAKRVKKSVHNRVAVLLAMAVVFSMVLLISVKPGSIANAAEGTDDIEYKYYTTVTVEKGETLWDLALENYSEKYYDSVDDYIDEVKEINGLKSDTIHEGAKLVIVYFSSEYK